MIVRNEEADHTVVAHEVGCCSGVDVRRRHLGRSVAIGKEESPVTQSDVVREVNRKTLGIRKRAIVVDGSLGQTRTHFLVGGRLLRKRKFNGFDELIFHRFDVVALFHHGAEHHEARIARGHGPAKDLRGHAGFNERLVKSSARGIGKNVGCRFHRIGVLGKSRRHAVALRNKLGFTRAADFEGARTIGNGLNRPGLRQHAVRALDLAERLLDPFENLGFVELAGNRQHGVIGLIPLAIERLQIFNGHIFNIAARPDRAAAIGVPIVEHGLHALEHHGDGLVFPHFVLVAHDGHFGVEVLLGDEGIGHRVGTPAERPLHVVVVGGKAHEVVRAVEPRRAVHAKTAAREFLGGIGIVLAALEHQVFEEMGHAGFAVVFHTAADEVGRVDRGRGLALIGKKNDLQTVVEFVALDAFDRVHGLEARSAGRHCSNCC